MTITDREQAEQDFTDAALPTPKQAALWAEELDDIRQAVSLSRKRDTELTAALKDYFARTAERELPIHDGAAVVKLQPRAGAPDWDLTHALDEDVLLAKAVPGLLTVDNTLFDAITKAGGAGWLDRLKGFRSRSRGTDSIVFVRKVYR